MTSDLARRDFLRTTAAAGMATTISSFRGSATVADELQPDSLERWIGITTGGLNYRAKTTF